MTEPFIASTDGGENWMICWTGVDTAINHWHVVTNHIHGSDLHSVTRGPQGDAELIARLLNWYYADEQAAEKMLKERKP